MVKKKNIDYTKINFSLTTKPKDLCFIFKERYRVFCVEKGVTKKNKKEKERDCYDQHSKHGILTLDKKIVAYTRMVADPFPIELACNLPDIFNRKKTLELSKAFVIREFRNSEVIWYLFQEIYNYCLDTGIETLLSFSNSVIFNGYKKRKIPFLFIGEAVNYHGHKSYPLIIKIKEGFSVF